MKNIEVTAYYMSLVSLMVPPIHLINFANFSKNSFLMKRHNTNPGNGCFKKLTTEQIVVLNDSEEDESDLKYDYCESDIRNEI